MLKLIGVATLLGSIALTPVWVHLGTKAEHQVTVSKAERVTTSDGQSKYLVYTDGGTFENVDSWLAWKFDSSDFHGAFAPGAECSLTTVGFRNQLFSWYPNVIDYNCKKV